VTSPVTRSGSPAALRNLLRDLGDLLGRVVRREYARLRRQVDRQYALRAPRRPLGRRCTRSSSAGPTRARSHFAGGDTLVCVLEDALLPAERRGDLQRVRESRVALQAATSDKFVGVIESIAQRKVIALASAIDANRGVVWEVFNFAPGSPRATE
jgi:uncharacterized protein YbcI